MKNRIPFALAVLASVPRLALGIPPATYADGRPQAPLRIEAKDQGVVLQHGDGPDGCDHLGAREAIVFEDQGNYYLNYDGAGPKGWLACQAVSQDLIHWRKHGTLLDFGQPGSPDSASASAPWVIRDRKWWDRLHLGRPHWRMFYLGTSHVSPAPNYVPIMPYLTLEARSRSPEGPWEKQYAAAPFAPRPGTYYSAAAAPGYVVEHQGRFLMFFSAAIRYPSVKRTLGLARAGNLDGPWTVDPEPILPLREQVENSSLYYEPKNQTWFLFTNHVGIDGHKREFTDAVWVYWSKDVGRWDAKNKAVVLDGRNCSWSKNCIGMPSVVKMGQRLALFYDAPGGDSIGYMNRDIGLAWLNLPLSVPARTPN